MAKSNNLVGARAKLIIKDKVVGIFSRLNYSVNQPKVPIHTLGRYGPQDLVPVGQGPVQLQLSGFRYLDRTPYQVAGATLLQQLLNEEDFQIKVVDRQSNKDIATFVGCRVVDIQTGFGSMDVGSLVVNIVALRMYDETVTGDDEVDGVTI